MSAFKLYCASLIGYNKNTITNQTTHLVAKTDEEAFKKACKIFENMHKDSKVRSYISCIELINVDGHRVAVD